MRHYLSHVHYVFFQALLGYEYHFFQKNYKDHKEFRVQLRLVFVFKWWKILLHRFFFNDFHKLRVCSCCLRFC